MVGGMKDRWPLNQKAHEPAACQRKFREGVDPKAASLESYTVIPDIPILRDLSA